MRNKLWQKRMLISIGWILLLAVSSPIAAQEDDPETIDYQPVGIEEELGDVIPFNVLGFDLQVLNSTKLETNYYFIMPAHWKLTEGASLSLDFLTTIYNNDSQFDSVIAGELQIFFNGIWLDSFPLETNGSQTLEIPLPNEALIPFFSSNSTNFLRIKLITNTNCNSSQSTTVAIQPSSFFTFPHQFVAPDLDLERLPYPIQQGSFLSDDAVIVIPDSPSPGEMQAFINTSAGLGRLASQTKYELVRVSELTEEMRNNNHLIMVGNSDSFTEFVDSSFLIPFNRSTSASKETDLNKLIHDSQKIFPTTDGLDLEETDGMLQIIQSPWNPLKAILFVGGNNDEGTMKAAKAIGYGIVRTGVDNTMAIINDVYFETNQPSSYKASQTLSDLGYEFKTLNGPTLTAANFSFFIPPGKEVPSEETATFLFVYNHSALLQYDLSGINIKLNNRPVHSLTVHEASTAVTQELIELPSVLIKSGPNTLRIEAELEPFDKCSDFHSEGTWLNIFPESSIYIPLGTKSVAELPVPMLNQFPQPLVFDTMLSTTTFVLPKDNSVAWYSAFQFAFELGGRVRSSLINLESVYAEDVTETMRAENNLVLIGLPSELPFLEELASYLPIPISRDTNRFEHDRLPIDYEIPPEVSLGYLNIINSPWHENFIILSILGDSEDGLVEATRTLLQSSHNLNGDFVVTEKDQRFTTMTPLLESEDATDDELVDNSEGVEAEAVSEELEVLESEEGEEEGIVVDDELSSEEDVETTVQIESDEESGAETAVSPTPSSNNNNVPSTVQRQGTTLPIVVLAVCMLALLGVGVRVLLMRRKA